MMESLDWDMAQKSYSNMLFYLDKNPDNNKGLGFSYTDRDWRLYSPKHL